MIAWLLVFLATALADVCWTKYMLEVTAHRAVASGLWSAAIVGFGAFTVVAYTTNHWLLSAAVLGAFVGTYITVRNA